MSQDEMEQERVNELVDQIAVAIKANYQKGPQGRARVFEGLNALAVSAAMITVATGDPITVDFFREAYNGQVAAMQKSRGHN